MYYTVIHFNNEVGKYSGWVKTVYLTELIFSGVKKVWGGGGG